MSPTEAASEPALLLDVSVSMVVGRAGHALS
jgi:hypothetical protein